MLKYIKDKIEYAKILQLHIESKISENESLIRLENIAIDNFNNERDLSLRKVANNINRAAQTVNTLMFS